MPPFMRGIALPGACLGGALLLLAGVDLIGLARLWGSVDVGLSPDDLMELDTAAGWALLAGGLIALPFLGYASVVPDARGLRSYLAAVPGAWVCALLIVISHAVLAAEIGPDKALQMASARAGGALSDFISGTTLLAVAVGAALAGGRAAGGGAAVAAPMVLLTVNAGFWNQSVMMSTAGALAPFVLLAALLVAAAATSGGKWRFLWVLGCGVLMAVTLVLLTGLATPRDAMVLAAIVALVVGFAAHAAGGATDAWKGLCAAVLEGAGIILALIAMASVGFTWVLLRGNQLPFDLASVGLVPALAIALAVYAVLSAIVTPVAALVALLPLAPELQRAGLAPEIIIVTATIAGMLGMIARTTAWRGAGPSGGIERVYFSRTGGLVALAGGVVLVALILAEPAIVTALPQTLR
jgi:hypothetical protein